MLAGVGSADRAWCHLMERETVWVMIQWEWDNGQELLLDMPSSIRRRRRCLSGPRCQSSGADVKGYRGRWTGGHTLRQFELLQVEGWRRLRSHRLELQSMIATTRCLWKCLRRGQHSVSDMAKEGHAPRILSIGFLHLKGGQYDPPVRSGRHVRDLLAHVVTAYWYAEYGGLEEKAGGYVRWDKELRQQMTRLGK
ncbi:hypothetical protein OE88DRAFT_511185 [Heliocybe sulcata]|uniref:Uncharacterized protein n=1 Tax=Heliocybe sulcata TaxID=5364 RepID=A0A5C3MXD1_9AGAM|nr:hypothetical protein OE88DRAFT_511185 [Heliocybe sulcata]